MGFLSRLMERAGGALGQAELERAELEQVRQLAQEREQGGRAESAADLGPKLRKRARFVGSVQGVGFRWTTTNLANSAGATGWVRNERDGSVTAEIQGIREQIDAVLEGLDRYYNQRRLSMGGFRLEELRDVEVQDGEQGFEARY